MWLRSSLEARWAETPKAPVRARSPELPAPSDSPDGCGVRGMPGAWWDRCWSCCCCDHRDSRGAGSKKNRGSTWLERQSQKRPNVHGKYMGGAERWRKRANLRYKRKSAGEEMKMMVDRKKISRLRGEQDTEDEEQIQSDWNKQKEERGKGQAWVKRWKNRGDGIYEEEGRKKRCRNWPGGKRRDKRGRKRSEPHHKRWNRKTKENLRNMRRQLMRARDTNTKIKDW